MVCDRLYSRVLLSPAGDGALDKLFYDRRFLKVQPDKNRAVYLKPEKLYA